jgi:outer membrane protein TolC
VDAAQRAVELVTINYRTGLTDFQNVLDTERSLFQQQDQLAESEGLITQNLIRVYRALGGGWPVPTN